LTAGLEYRITTSSLAESLKPVVKIYLYDVYGNLRASDANPET
jgi:hypothetical protein